MRARLSQLSQDLLFNMPIRQGNTATNLMNFAPGINNGAAYGGGSVGLAGAALYALLREEARSARRRVEARTSKDDPPSGDGTCGIIACAKDVEGKAHILADHSVTRQSPESWSRTVAEAAALWTHLHPGAPLLVVAESNQGGLMVTAVLRISNPDLNIKLVPAIQGKTDRATPVALRFEAGKALLHGPLQEG